MRGSKIDFVNSLSRRNFSFHSAIPPQWTFSSRSRLLFYAADPCPCCSSSPPYLNWWTNYSHHNIDNVLSFLITLMRQNRALKCVKIRVEAKENLGDTLAVPFHTWFIGITNLSPFIKQINTLWCFLGRVANNWIMISATTILSRLRNRAYPVRTFLSSRIFLLITLIGHLWLSEPHMPVQSYGTFFLLCVL